MTWMPDPNEHKATENSKLQRELSAILNRASREGLSNTPDFILAEYLLNCLEAFELATLGLRTRARRVEWHNGETHPQGNEPATTGGPPDLV